MKNIAVSNNVIRRLPRYLRRLDELKAEGIERVSSKELGSQLGLTPSQIRQDFSCFGEFGQQGYGYNVEALRDEIAVILGTDRGYRAIIVGAGKIGMALMNNFDFSEQGITLTCAFDTKPELVGTEVNGIPVKPAESMIDYVRNNKIDIAVICVPKEKAADTAGTLIENGVNAFWNFTNIELTGPNSTAVVENIHFSDSLFALSYFLSDYNDEKAAREARLQKRAGNNNV